jgi:hypothetical protein
MVAGYLRVTLKSYTMMRPGIGAYCFVTIASGKLNTRPIKPPFAHPGIGSGILKIIKPMANRLIKDAVIALILFSNAIKNIGMMETIPKIILQ